jgi:hypothetical protein
MSAPKVGGNAIGLWLASAKQQRNKDTIENYEHGLEEILPYALKIQTPQPPGKCDK